jgi:DNA replication and repair protein RecF
LEIGPTSVVLTGSNGAGKTSILEALSLLAPGRGLRRARLEELPRWRPGEADPVAPTDWAVAARLSRADEEIDVGTGCTVRRQPAGSARARERRQVRIDGRPAKSQAVLAEVLGMTWLTPEMDRLFVDGASSRRRFLDRLVFGLDPAHAARVAAYERALQQRARLLRQGAAADPTWLTALEDTMATTGVAVAAARRDATARLTQASRRGSGPFPAADLGSSGEVEDWLDREPALSVEDKLRAALKVSRTKDAETGGAVTGPHKGDLLVRHSATARPAGQCSTGEQKALLVAIVLASARVQSEERGVTPIVLLDEVAAHLDARHRAALFDAVSALDVQAWYAGTDRTVFEPLRGRAQFFAVEGAVATAAPREG